VGRSEAFGVCTGLLCLVAAVAVDAAPRAAYFGPGGNAPRAPEIMLYFSHAVGSGAGGGSMKPTFGLRVQQIRQAANNGDPEQGDGMQHRELLNWQMEAHSNMHLSQSRVKLGNKLTYDFASSRFGSPSRSVMQIGTPSLRNGFASSAQPKQFAARNPAGGFAAGASSAPGHDSSRDNSAMREVAAAAIAALTPSRFTAPQRLAAQRPGGITAIAAAQRLQGATALR
jgi:hypothetical protein